MLHTEMKMDCICRYIAEYTTYIRSMKANSLFDPARLFEMFAQKVCRIQFGQEFFNLNQRQRNYPYVDLVSKDKQIFVQVSTVEDVPNKIRTTLKDLSNAPKEKQLEIKELVFFVLDNDSIKKVHDYKGEDRLGLVDFEKSKNLISTKTIIEKAGYDLQFQEALYHLVHDDLVSPVALEKQLMDEVEHSQFQLDEIDSLINHEYRIDRSARIKEITAIDNRFVLIEGAAGAGKSVLCKTIVENELALYVRADALIQFRNLRDIWRGDLRQLLFALGGKRIYLFVDALEYISDGGRKERALLRQIFEVASQFDNAYVIASCRSSESKAFSEIISYYDIFRYELEELNEEELRSVARKYPVVERLMAQNSYKEILYSPFYLNLVVSKIKDADNISNENELRHCIWNEVICLGNSIPDGISSIDIRETVEKITFERAQKFIPGINEDDVERKILNALISNDIVTNYNHKIRLKYDIFEDICFEVQFDKLFDECKGRYEVFFEKIKQYGPCVYRRYQIWVENKLLGRNNRERFISEILFDGMLSKEWQDQTIIGIVRSRFSAAFFHENELKLSESGMYLNIIRVLNLYSFDISIEHLANKQPYLMLRPVGHGRESIIGFIARHRLYEKGQLQGDIFTLLQDYSLQEKERCAEIDNMAVQILVYFLDLRWERASHSSYHELDKTAAQLMQCLTALYSLAEFAQTQIKEFWSIVTEAYKEEDHGYKHRLAEILIEETIKNPTRDLVRFCRKQLCMLADLYWLYVPERKRKNQNGLWLPESNDYGNPFGLTWNAKQFGNLFKTLGSCYFLKVLFQENFREGLNWAISLVNRIVEHAVRLNPEMNERVSIRIDNKTVSFYGSGEFWMVGTEDSNVPKLIGDIVVQIRDMISSIMSDDSIELSQRRSLAKFVKQAILAQTNNIFLLRIIADIGVRNAKILTDYASFLATSLDIVYWDNCLIARQNPSDITQKLKQQIYRAMGMPPLPERYPVLERESLTNYVIELQLFYPEEVKKKIHSELDHLYGTVEDTPENAEYTLLIQKMDIRKYHHNASEKQIILTPAATGEAGKLVDAYKESPHELEKRRLESLVQDLRRNYESGEMSLDILLRAIDSLKSEFSDEVLEIQISEFLVTLIALAFSNDELSVQKRSELCEYWIDGIERIFDSSYFHFEQKLSGILFQQLDHQLSSDVAKKLRLLILRCVFRHHENGILDDITRLAEGYLSQHEDLAESMFYAVIELAKVSGINKITLGCPVEAVQEYLAGNRVSCRRELSFAKCDITSLSYAANCGLQLCHQEFYSMMKYLLFSLLMAWQDRRNHHDMYELESNLREYLTESLTKMDQPEKTISLLFQDVDPGLFHYDAIKYYLNILSTISAVYFDAHSNPTRREQCEKLCGLLEKYILAIPEETVRDEMLRSLFLYQGMIPIDAWKDCETHYQYRDKQFLNDLWSKYGAGHLTDLLVMVYMFHMEELLPEILISVSNCFLASEKDLTRFANEIYAVNSHYIVNVLITRAYLDFRDEIKADEQISRAYENILSSLTRINFREAAVLADEFRIH